VWDELRVCTGLDHLPGRTDDLLGGRAEERHLAQWFVVQLNPRCAVVPPYIRYQGCRCGGRAVPSLRGAVAATPAMDQNEKNDAIAVVALSPFALFSTTMPAVSRRGRTPSAVAAGNRVHDLPALMPSRAL
jgi:hypothetical protein